MDNDTYTTRCGECGGAAYLGRSGWATAARPWLHTERADWASRLHQVVPTTITRHNTEEKP